MINIILVTINLSQTMRKSIITRAGDRSNKIGPPCFSLMLM